jgi:hypothetical protein
MYSVVIDCILSSSMYLENCVYLTLNICIPVLVKLTTDLVLFTRPEKALVRTVRGTNSRRESEKLYEEEIDRLYHREIGS